MIIPKPFFKHCCLLALGFLLLNGPELLAQTFTVTSTADNANPFVLMPGQLRWAISKANASATTATIAFNIQGTGPFVIQPVTFLPSIQKSTIVDATTQPGYTPGNPAIILDGSLQNGSIGLDFAFAPNSKVKGFYIRNFPSLGIALYKCSGTEISNNIINRYPSAPGPTKVDVELDQSSNCIVRANYLGTDPALTDFSTQRGEFGILFIGASNSNQIGTGLSGDGNTIAYHSFSGISFTTSSQSPVMGIFNLITQNRIFNSNQLAIDLVFNGLNFQANQNKQYPVINTITTLTNVSGTAGSNDIVELFGSSGTQNANQYLTTVRANGGGHWTANLSTSTWPFVTATATDRSKNTSQLSAPQPLPSPCPACSSLSFTFPSSNCNAQGISFNNTSPKCSGNPVFSWNYGDGSAATASNVHTFTNPGSYRVTLSIPGSPACPPKSVTQLITITNCPPPCIDCLPSFAPQPDSTYIISAWVRQVAAPSVLSYTNPQIFLDFAGHPTQGPFTAKGDIIDGWQRIEEQFTVPHGATSFAIRLSSVSGDVFFDDIRVFPFKGSMKSYVYDPITLRLVAELDERNYATIYEYDEEGKLIRLKKETERGIMTIKENKNSIVKKP
jgi:hypothetical protein